MNIMNLRISYKNYTVKRIKFIYWYIMTLTGIWRSISIYFIIKKKNWTNHTYLSKYETCGTRKSYILKQRKPCDMKSKKMSCVGVRVEV